jgi:hypothetical protein
LLLRRLLRSSRLTRASAHDAATRKLVVLVDA